MKSQINLQDTFLNEIRKKESKVTIYLVNGFRLSGIVEGFDNFTVILETDDGQQMVYKHAISTIVPKKKVENLFKNKE